MRRLLQGWYLLAEGWEQHLAALQHTLLKLSHQNLAVLF